MSVPVPSAVQMEPLVSMQDLADTFGVPLLTVRRWRKYGKGPKGYRIGKHVKFRMSEVEAWLQAQREDEGNTPS